MSIALLEHEARAALEQYGIKNVPGAFCTNMETLSAAAAKIGYPVVLKVVSPQIVHKSDAGGVKVNIPDVPALKAAYEGILASVKRYDPKAEIMGMLITKFVPKARELIVGAVEDSQFGAVVMAGLGGIFVEIFKDISFGIAPINAKEAMSMLQSLKAYPILNGARGEAPVNFDALCELLVNVSRFAWEKGVLELDLNPVLCVGDDVLVGDARILLPGEGGANV